MPLKLFMVSFGGLRLMLKVKLKPVVVIKIKRVLKIAAFKMKQNCI